MNYQSNPWYLNIFKEDATEMWRRWLPLWHLAVFMQLLIALVLTLLSDSSAYNPQTWALLHLAYIGWYSLSIRFDPAWWRERPRYFAIYVLSGWAIWWILASGSMNYFILLSGLFPQLYIYAALRSAIIGTVALNSVVLLRLALFFPDSINTLLLITLMTSSGAVIVGFFIDDIVNQSRERRELIDNLKATRAQLAEAERLNGVAQERQRLAADLHDTLVQSLISVVTHLEAAENSPEQQHYHLQTAKQAARDSLYDARQAIWDLQLSSADAQSFQESLQILCQQWKQRSHLPIEFIQAGDAIHLSGEIQQAIHRIVQEALSNISRHAQATQVFVTLKFTEDCVKLFIMDDGIGFDELSNTGNGISNMCQRAQALNGKCSVESESSTGTTITVTFPQNHINESDHHAD